MFFSVKFTAALWTTVQSILVIQWQTSQFTHQVLPKGRKEEGKGETEVCSLKKKTQKTARENFAFKESWKNTEILNSSVKPFALKTAIYFKRLQETENSKNDAVTWVSGTMFGNCLCNRPLCR